MLESARRCELNEERGVGGGRKGKNVKTTSRRAGGVLSEHQSGTR